MTIVPASLFTAALEFIRRQREPKACAHRHLVFDSYGDTTLAACLDCDEAWVSDDGLPPREDAHA